MRRILGIAVVAALTGICPSAQAQTAPRQAPAERAWTDQEAQGARAFSLVMHFREDLALSDAQVARLEAIGARLDERNGPLVERRRAELRSGARAGQGKRQRTAPTSEQQALRQQIHANARAAGEEAWAVLTPPQQLRARQIAEERRQEITERLRERQERTSRRR